MSLLSRETAKKVLEKRRATTSYLKHGGETHGHG